MTRSKFTRIGVIGAAVAGIAAAMTVRTPDANAWPTIVTPRTLACYAVGCPADVGPYKCGEPKIELKNEALGSISVTYTCYLQEKSQQIGPPEGEM